ncbi:MAG: DUF262 domain-containing HNH endonuclease family protein, partial [Rickettsiales bacterium]|nr:DUF262 domain-containing HNH endonuclease family protein [Rickettsiales bacterium]
GKINNLIIPVYQRNYDWEYEHCKTLYDDIVDLIGKDKRNHYIGPIVSVLDKDGRIIIDGQQRITTISLILIAIYRILKDKEIELDISENKRNEKAQDIYENYIEDDSIGQKLRLKIAKSNQKSYGIVANISLSIDKIKESGELSNIYKNFYYFFETIKKDVKDRKYNIIDFLEKMDEIVVIDVILEKDNGDDPELIFETLNSTGKPLEQSDLIRNFLLMNLFDEEIQNKMYNEYWLKIEDKLKNLEIFKDFFKHYLMGYKLGKSSYNENTIYTEFKGYYNNSFKKEKDSDNDKQKEQSLIATKFELAEDVLKYSNIYNNIKIKKIFNGDKDINIHIQNIIGGHFLDYSIIYPFLFWLVDNEEKIGIDNIKELLYICECFLLKRFICGGGIFSTANLSSIFTTLGKNIEDKLKNNDNDYIKTVLSIFNKRGFPSNKRCIEELKTLKIYSKKSNHLAKYILYKIEDLLNNGKETIKYDEKLNIEHILPKKYDLWNLDDAQQKEIGVYLDTFGNLTIMDEKLNTAASNSIFKNKKEKYFKKSNIRMNRDIAEKYNVWNIDSIKERTDEISNYIIEIWKYEGNNDFVVEKGEIDENCVIFDGEILDTSNCRSQIDIYRKIIEKFYNIDSAKLRDFVNKNKNLHFNTDYMSLTYDKTKDNHPYFKMGELYFSTITNLEVKQKNIQKIASYYDIEVEWENKQK